MRWVLSRTNDEYLTYLSKKTGISRTLSQILINRGIKEPSQIKEFLNPSLSLLSDPFDFEGMRDAVLRIKEAIRNKESIFIHGDYDVDGLSGTAILFDGLKRLGADVHFFIPSRHFHGYGFNEAGLRMARDKGASLIITVDCGIKSFSIAREARRLGIDLIITDHHLPLMKENKPILPEAIAVLNPKINPQDSTMHLSGAGVVFKLLQALYGSIEHLWEYLDLLTIATVGDIVPLKGENRHILSEGLSFLKNSERPGLRALLELAGMKDRELTASNLSFTLIPRLNAAGRLEEAGDVIRLLLTEDSSEAETLALWLDKLNRKRQLIEEDIYEEALEIFRLKYDEIPDGIVLIKEGWHPGVLGIIASRFQEEFYRPAFIFTLRDGVATGSVRSIPEIDIIKILDSLQGFFLRYGGHSQAAGMSLYLKDFDHFERALKKALRDRLGDEKPVPTLRIDAQVAFEQINYGLLSELKGLEPLGYGNEEPLFGAKNIIPLERRVVGNGHLKLRLKQGGSEFDVIGFGMADLIDITSGAVDIAFLPQINDFNGRRAIQLKIRAIRKAVE
ncbi:MAG: single-stranded-DNA-specific exonuclease RecJ [Thermodesulfovibrionales bacterium]|nr:single-stranded-DNA-specific exonuclease RecJ [Thermodesulfovibrionales bacterium]